MKQIDEHEYTTYPRRFNGYRWYKPLLIGALFLVFMVVLVLLAELVTKSLFGAVSQSTGYDDMDLFTAGGAFANGIIAVLPIPALFLAALIVRDRPISSYLSSMGGWRWKVFFKTMLAAFVILGIPTVVSFLVRGTVSDIRFTLGGFLLLTLVVPFQGFAEELTYRSYITQTVSSWFRLPIAGIIVQIILFTIVHPYNLVGLISIAISAVIYVLVCMYSRGLESSTALHIANNLSELYMTGFGFGLLTSEQTVFDSVYNLFFKLLFLTFIIYANKKLHWFDTVKADDVTKFNAKKK